MSAQDKHDHLLVRRHGVDDRLLYEAWQMLLVDEPEFHPQTNSRVYSDIDGYAYILILDDELVETQDIRNFRDLELKANLDPSFRTYICRLPDGSYLLESHV